MVEMKLILTYLTLVFLISGAQPQDCTIAYELTPEKTLTPGAISPLEAGHISKTTEPGNIPGFVVNNLIYLSWAEGKGCNKDFFNINQVNETYISMEIPDNFSQIVDAYKTDANPECYINIHWNESEICKPGIGGMMTEVLIIIDDVNLAEPKFEKDSYDLTIAFPLGQGISFKKAFDLAISATDSDFSTKLVSFNIEGGSDDFELFPSTNGRIFSTDIRTKNPVNYQKAVSLVLIATDDGTNQGPKSSKATLTINPDLPNSFPPIPEFEDSLLQAEISEADLTEGSLLPIAITMHKIYEGLKLEVINNDNFNIQPGNDAQHFVLAVVKAPGEEAYFVLQLKATIDNDYHQSTNFATVFLYLTSDPSETETPATTDSTSDPIGNNTVPSSSPLPPSPLPPVQDDGDSTGLLVSTIVLAIIAAACAGILAWGYYRFVRIKPKILPTSHFENNTATNYSGTTNAAFVDEKTPSNNHGSTLKPEEKTRKRSMTFSENDQESRVNREGRSKSDISEKESSKTDLKSESGVPLTNDSSKVTSL